MNSSRTVLAIAVATVTGCATLPHRAADRVNDGSPAMHVVSAERARNAVTIGRSTRAEVLTALGPASTVRFDSGYEVWVYRLAQDRPARTRPVSAEADEVAREPSGEFVILFAPSGLATKVRLRPALAPR